MRLRQLAEGEGLRLNYRLICDSFIQASRAVQSGHYAAILPDLAREDLDGDHFTRIEWPGLRSETRTICLAWHKRTLRLRPVLEKVLPKLQAALTPPDSRS